MLIDSYFNHLKEQFILENAPTSSVTSIFDLLNGNYTPRKILVDAPDRKNLEGPHDLPGAVEVSEEVEITSTPDFKPYWVLDKTDIINCCWESDDDFVGGISRLRERAVKPVPPTPAEFYAAFMMATIRNDDAGLDILRLFEWRHGDTEKDWLMAMISHVGSWKKRRTPAGEWEEILTPMADEWLRTNADPYFVAKWKMKAAIRLLKGRDRDSFSGDRRHDQQFSAIEKLLNEALATFEKRSRFDAGRTERFLAQIQPNFDLELEHIEKAKVHFDACRMAHLQFRTKEARTVANDKKKIFRLGLKNRSVLMGNFLRQLENARDIPEFSQSVVDYLSSDEFLSFPSVSFEQDEIKLERTTVHAATSHQMVRSEVRRLPLSGNYYLVIPESTDPHTLTMVLSQIRLYLDRLLLRTGSQTRHLTTYNQKMKFQDPAFNPVVEKVEFCARTKQEAAIFLLGPTGAGKTDLAEAIHYQCSYTKDKLFRYYNCAETGEHNRFMADVFGWVKGAWNSADADGIGLIESAGEGTLFLDEVGELRAEFQAALLKAIGERTYTRFGDKAGNPRKVRCRIIAATNRPVRKWIEQDPYGKFRLDLFARFFEVIELPGLKEAPGQISILADTFCKESPSGYKLDPDALELFLRYDWPENVRELAKTILKAKYWAEGLSTKVLTRGIFQKVNPRLASFSQLPEKNEARDLDPLEPALAELVDEKLILTQTLVTQVESEPFDPQIRFAGKATDRAFLELLWEILAEFPSGVGKTWGPSLATIVSRMKREDAVTMTVKSFDQFYTRLIKTPFYTTQIGRQKTHYLGTLYRKMYGLWHHDTLL